MNHIDEITTICAGAAVACFIGAAFLLAVLWAETALPIEEDEEEAQ